MKKLMTMIAAVATAFGLYAADTPDPSTYYSTSFEANDAGCSDGTTFDWEAAGWETDCTDEFKLADQSGTLPYADGRVRRNEFFNSKNVNNKYLTLATGNNEIKRAIGGDGDRVFFDQLVKFTGFEEAPVVAEGTKIAVWMSATETEDGVDGATNLYVTAGTGIAATNLQIAADVEVDTWYRLTIKSLGNVIDASTGMQQVGFLVYIDGQLATIVEAQKDYHANPTKLLAPADGFYAKGQLFTAIDTTTATLASVGYQGIGGVDDIIFSKDAPDFAASVNVTVKSIDGAVIEVKDANGNVIDLTSGYYTLPRGAFTVTYTAADSYILPGAPIVKPYNTEVTTVVDDSDTVKPAAIVVTVNYDDTNTVAYADAASALAAVEAYTDIPGNSVVVDFKQGVTNQFYAFDTGTKISIDDDYVAPEEETEVEPIHSYWDITAGNVKFVTGLENNKIVTIDDDHVLTFAGTMKAGSSITAKTIVAEANAIALDPVDCFVITLNGNLDAAFVVPTGYTLGKYTSDDETDPFCGWTQYYLEEAPTTFEVTVELNAENVNIESIVVDGEMVDPVDYEETFEVEESITVTYKPADGYKWVDDGETGIVTREEAGAIEAPEVKAKTGFIITIGENDPVEYEDVADALAAVQAAEAAGTFPIVVKAIDAQTVAYEGQEIVLAADDQITIPALRTWEFSNGIVITPTKGIVLAVGASLKVKGTIGAGLISAPADYKIATATEGDYTIYTVVAKVYVAQVGDNKFETLAEAVEAAQTTDTVALLADVTLTETLQITKATAINLAGKEITLAANLDRGINAPNAGSLTISNGTIAVASGRANIGYSRAIYLLHTSGVFKDLVIDVPGFEYALNKDCDTEPDSACWDKPLANTLVCENVAINGNGSLFHIENAEATLKDCVTTVNTELPSFGSAHEAAIYSSCGAVTTVDGGSYTAPNALQTGNYGGDIIVKGGEFNGNIKSWMLDNDTRDFADVNMANITIEAGKFTGNFVYADGCSAESPLLSVVISGGDFSDTTIPVKFIEVKEGYDASWVASETYANYVTPAWTLQQEYGGGSGTEADPYLMKTAAHFTELQTKIANNDYAGTFFKLDANVTLTDWTGIGNGSQQTGDDRPFSGVFNGDGKTLTVSYARALKYMGLFNCLSGGAVVSNLTIQASVGNVIGGATSYGIGAVAGEAAGDATIADVTVNGELGNSDVPLTHNAAGFVVYIRNLDTGTVTFKDCVNNAAVYTSYNKAGGFVANGSNKPGASVVLENCVNTAAITGTGSATSTTVSGIGGLIGYRGESGPSTFTDCSNSGVITAGGAYVCVGSFVGRANGNSVVTGLSGNSAQANIPAVGYETGKITGLHFATVDANGVATFVADNALALNGEYKVMAPNATANFVFTQAGTIAFDEALVAVTTFAITADTEKFDLTDATVGTVKTYTCVAKSTDPRQADPQDDTEVGPALVNLGVSELAKENIKTVAEFKAFEGYFAAKTDGVDWENVTAGQKANAYLCYALNAAAIPTEEITDGDVTINSFANGVIEIAIDGVVAGESVSAEMIAKVIDVIGNNALTEMTADKVEASGQATANGKVQVTVAPDESIEDKSKFFYRASVKK